MSSVKVFLFQQQGMASR